MIRSLQNRQFGLWLFALALAARLIVAPGFMPVTAATGGLTIEMCTGQGAVTVHVPGKPDHAPETRTCDFAALGNAAATPFLLPIAVLLVPIAMPAMLVLEQLSPNSGVPAPPPPARGPPRLI